ncbi:MAG: hypothetical protein ACOZF0_01000 [Thermodesulfobacteriota bacterium]
MKQPELSKLAADKIGRSMNLVYNQAAMYHPGHPAVVRSVEQLFEALKEGFKKVSPIIFSMNQEKFFIEDEPVDYHINTARLADYFVKAGIQSISFERRMTLEELQTLVEIVFDTKRTPDVKSMKKALETKGVASATINYVIFKKITLDEEVVLRERLQQQLSALDGDIPSGGNRIGGMVQGEVVDLRAKVTGPTTEDVLGMMMAEAISESFENQFSIAALLEDPGVISAEMIRADVAFAEQHRGKGQTPGPMIIRQIQSIRNKVGRGGDADVDLKRLAEGVMELKGRLLKGLEAQKALGTVYPFENDIRKEIDELTDSVLIRLVQEEYRKGEVPIRRLAQIIVRLIPEADELRRLLPKIRHGLMTEGMPLADFYNLIQELKAELQSDNLSRMLDQSAREIGLEGDILIHEILEHPKEAAELIYLASEIRRGGGDRGELTGILVEYIETVGSRMALDEADSETGTEGKQLDGMYAKARNDLIGALKNKQLDAAMLKDIEYRIMARLEENMRQLKSELVLRKLRSGENTADSKAAIRNILSVEAASEEEVNAILGYVKKAMLERGMSEDRFEQLRREMVAAPEAKTEEKSVPKRTLNKGSTLFILDSEIRRAKRYHTPFSTLVLTPVKVTPKKAVPQGSISREDVTSAVMEDLVKIVRDTDIVGIVDSRLLIVIQPMTSKDDSRTSLARITSLLKDREFLVKEMPFEIRFACVSTSFNPESKGDYREYLTAAQRELSYLAKRLANIQSFM